MIPALVEGHLEGRLLTVLWRQLGKAETPLVVRNAGGSPFWQHARRYNEAGKSRIVLGLADLEQLPCAAAALASLGRPLSQGFKLRLAVRMIESWVMADRAPFAAALGVPLNRIPIEPDRLSHPKRAIVEMARNSSKRAVREALVPSGLGLVGAEYLPFIADFVERGWSVGRARINSPSLERACLRWASL